jgi:O-antigen/teichoic acid export membrane protein
MVSSARLRRELRFGAVAVAEIAAEVTFLAVAIALVFTPYAHSSLPAGLAARITAYSLALWIADHRFVAAMPTVASARELGRFSVTVWGAALVHNASFNADFVLVGRWLGPSALGFYSMAWDLLRFVPDRLHRVVGRVAFPAFARMRDNQELRGAFLEFFGYMARLVIPVMILAIVTAPDLIGTVYGPKWIPTVVPLRLLAVGFILVGLRLGIGPIFYTKDHPSFDIYLHGVRLVAVIAAVTATISFGIAGVSASMSAVEGAVSVFGIYLACRLIELPIARVVSASWIGVWLALLCGALAFTFRAMGLALGIRGIPMLALEVTPAMIAFAYSQAGDVKAIVSKATGAST